MASLPKLASITVRQVVAAAVFFLLVHRFFFSSSASTQESPSRAQKALQVVTPFISTPAKSMSAEHSAKFLQISPFFTAGQALGMQTSVTVGVGKRVGVRVGRELGLGV